MTISQPSPTPTDTEPVLSAGVIIALAEAIIMALTAFGVSITADQHTAIIALLGAVLAVAAAIIPALRARKKAVPLSAVAERVEGGAVIAGPANDVLAEGTRIRDVGQLPDTP